MTFPYWNYLYYFVIPLQVICILHALKTGRNNWLYLLIFLPLVGCIVYLIREVFPTFSAVGAGMNLFSGGRIKELERQRRIADTETNRLQLAEEYARHGQFDKALELTESCITGIYEHNTGMMLDMARYSFGAEHYADTITWFDKAKAQKETRPEKPEDEIMYAKSLYYSRQSDKAEEAYKRIIKIHHSMEARYNYGMLLKESGRNDEARAQFRAVLDEKDLHPQHVRRMNSKWISGSRIALMGLK